MCSGSRTALCVRYGSGPDPDPTRFDLSAAKNLKSRSHRNMQTSTYEKKKKKKVLSRSFSIFVSPFNGYIARFLGGSSQHFDTNLIGFAIQKGGLRSGSGTLTSGSGFRSLHWKVKNKSLKPRSWLLLKNYLLTSSLPVNTARMATILTSL